MAADCKCDKCIAGCKRNPGWFAPGEAEKAAAHCNMTLDEFKNEYLVKEWWAGGPSVYAPRRTTQPKGFPTASFRDGFDHSTCIFLDEEDLCAIHDVKPMECGISYGCKQYDSPTNAIREQVVKLWAKAGSPLGTEDEDYGMDTKELQDEEGVTDSSPTG
jgi:Fe-S-cluster containining protein